MGYSARIGIRSRSASDSCGGLRKDCGPDNARGVDNGDPDNRIVIDGTLSGVWDLRDSDSRDWMGKSERIS